MKNGERCGAEQHGRTKLEGQTIEAVAKYRTQQSAQQPGRRKQQFRREGCNNGVEIEHVTYPPAILARA